MSGDGSTENHIIKDVINASNPDWEISSVKEISGGLFNRVFLIEHQFGKNFIKTFSEKGKDPAFPDLPTSAVCRASVAAYINEIGDRIKIDSKLPIRTAQLHSYNTSQPAVIVESVPGKPLQHSFIKDKNLSQVREIITTVIQWLAKFHQTYQPHETYVNDVRPFKEYKTKLQYTEMLQFLSPESKETAMDFIENHTMDRTSILLGDINSRNILVDYPNIYLIDFEQGQYGQGVHDVAYILSELVIANFFRSQNPDKDINYLKRTYFDSLQLKDEADNFDKHLFFQILYRLKGPSKTTWSGHLSSDTYSEILEWCLFSIHEIFKK